MNAQTRYDEINVLINRGEYSTAAKKIDSLISASDLSGEEIYSLQFQKDKTERIKKDFRRTEEYILKVLSKYYPSYLKKSLSNGKKMAHSK